VPVTRLVECRTPAGQLVGHLEVSNEFFGRLNDSFRIPIFEPGPMDFKEDAPPDIKVGILELRIRSWRDAQVVFGGEPIRSRRIFQVLASQLPALRKLKAFRPPKKVWTKPIIAGPLDLMRLLTDSLQKLSVARKRARIVYVERDE
jgi:hypothetical protein